MKQTTMMLVLTAAVLVAESAGAGEVLQTLSCRFDLPLVVVREGSPKEFDLDADMTSKKDFLGEADYSVADKEYTYLLSQKSPRNGERHRFILSEADPYHALQVQVFHERSGDLYKARARQIGHSGPLRQYIFEGSCFYF